MSSGNIGPYLLVAIVAAIAVLAGLVLIGIAIGKHSLWFGIGGVAAIVIGVIVFLNAHAGKLPFLK